MKYFLIFAAFLFASCEDKNVHYQCLSVEFSDALPIQFWLADCETYNERTPKGVHYKCFCHPWKCDDELKIQFRDFFDSSEVVTEEVETPIVLPALSTWLTTSMSSNIDWTLGATPTVNLPGAFPVIVQSEILYTPYSFITGREYTITLNFTRVTNSGVSPNTCKLSIYDAAFNVLEQGSFLSSSGANSKSITFTATSLMDRIGFTHTSGANVDITVTSTSGTRIDFESTYPDPDNFDLVVYDEEDVEIERTPFAATLNPTGFYYSFFASLIPSDIDVCEQKIKFQVVNTSASPDVVVAKSDCILISDAVADNDGMPTVLMQYSNNRNFAGLDYENISPEVTFNLRVPAVFFHERFPEEDEVAELSTSIITLNGEMRAQRLFETPHLPYYMHRKIKLVLKHQVCEIDGLAIAKQDAYEIDEGDRRWPEKKAKCWLTEQNFVQRNVV